MSEASEEAAITAAGSDLATSESRLIYDGAKFYKKRKTQELQRDKKDFIKDRLQFVMPWEKKEF